MIEIRPSSLAINAACTASVVAPTVKINTSGDPARIGSAVHAFMAQKVPNPDATPDIHSLAEEFSVEAEDLAAGAWQTWRAWQTVADYFPDPQTEVHLGPIQWNQQVTLQGTCDVLSRPTPTLLRLLDYKGTWSESEHEVQVKGYGILGLRKWLGEVETVEAVVINTRIGTKMVYRWTAAEVEQWFDRLCTSIVNGTETFSPSASNCKFCRRAFDCPARQQLVKSCAESVLSVNIAELTPDTAAELLGRARLVIKAAEEAVEIVRAEVAARGGSMPLSDGRVLQLTPQKKRLIKALPAWPILTRVCGERLEEAVRISKTTCEKIIGDNAAPRMKGKDKAAFSKELEDANAFEVRVDERLEIVKPAEKIETSTQEVES